MSELAKYVTRYIKVGPAEVEKKKLFLKGMRTVTDPHFVAADDLADAIAEACNELDALGYDIISVFPTLRGESHATNQYGYGYSVTDGAVITAKLQ